MKDGEERAEESRNIRSPAEVTVQLGAAAARPQEWVGAGPSLELVGGSGRMASLPPGHGCVEVCSFERIQSTGWCQMGSQLDPGSRCAAW